MKKCRTLVEKCIKWKPDQRIVALFAMLALLIVLVPLVRIAFYAVPWYDDYNYGGFAKNFWALEPSLKSLWAGLLYNVKTQWYAFQGTYASIFFMTLMPAVWGEDKYFIGALALIFLLVLAVFVLVKVLVINVLKKDWTSCVILQAVTAILTVLLVHRSQQAFYWYIGGMHYVGMHSFCILWISACIYAMTVDKVWIRIVMLPITIVGASMAAGANFVTALQGAIFLVCVIGITLLVCEKNRNRVLWLLPAVGIYGFGFYKNVSAPGNQVRAAYYVGWGLGPVQAVLQSFVEGFKHLWSFTGWMTILIMIILIPVIWKMVDKSNFVFRYPALVLVFSFCVYATGFTPSLYSIGSAGLSRTMNAIRLTFQLLLLVNEVYCLGWLRNRFEKKGRTFSTENAVWWFYGLIFAAMIIVFCAEPDKIGTYSTWGAYENVHSGEAYNFYQQYLERVELLKGDDSVVEFRPYDYTPWVICTGDLSEDPNAEENRAIADWYDKEAVICKDKTE